MDPSQYYLGNTLALLAALVWAFAVIMFKKSGEQVQPIALNLFKNLLSFFLIIPTTMIFGQTLLHHAPAGDYWRLILSGALGIGIADTLFLQSLNLLGAGLSAIVNCLYSPFIVFLSFLWLGEHLSFLQLGGVFLIISAVLTTTGTNGKGTISRRNLWLGILWGVLAIVANGIGVVIVKPVLEKSPLLWVTEVRLLSGIVVLAIVLLFHPGRRGIMLPKITPRGFLYTLSGSFAGAYLSMIIWLGAMKLTQASIVGPISQTSNVFIFLFAALFLKEKVDRLRVLGIILAVSGSLLVAFG